MNNSKHTPGPWLVSESEPSPENPKPYAMITFQNHRLAKVLEASNWIPGSLEANARLIAAAPELLEAARATRNYFVLAGESFLGNKEKNLLQMVVAAITKAEGKE